MKLTNDGGYRAPTGHLLSLNEESNTRNGLLLTKFWPNGPSVFGSTPKLVLTHEFTISISSSWSKKFFSLLSNADRDEKTSIIDFFFLLPQTQEYRDGSFRWC